MIPPPYLPDLGGKGKPREAGVFRTPRKMIELWRKNGYTKTMP